MSCKISKRNNTKMGTVWTSYNFMIVIILLLAILTNASEIQSLDDNLGKGNVNKYGVMVGAKGGTELMMEALHARLPKIHKERFNIISTRVREVSKDKINILWLHDLPQDPENRHLSEASSRARFANIVFVSNWQKVQFEEYFRMKFENGIVLRNAIEPFEIRNYDSSVGAIEPLRLIYHTTPHRGLDILLRVFFQIYKDYQNTRKIVLDVYSSFSIYDQDEKDAFYTDLFDQCREHPACNYHGAVSNDEIRDALQQSHIFAYPSTWHETSCIAAIEALSAGLEVVTSNIGALPETTNGFATMYPYTENKLKHADYFYQALKHAITEYHNKNQIRKRRMQQIFAAQQYDWGFWAFHGRMKEWVAALTVADHDSIIRRADQRYKFNTVQEKVEALTIKGMMIESLGNIAYATSLYKSALDIDSNFPYALVAMGNLLVMADLSESKRGAMYLEDALTQGHPNLHPNTFTYYEIATRLGYHYSGEYRNSDMQKWLDKAAESLHPHTDCWDIFRATNVMHLPLSKEEATKNLKRFHQFTDELLKKDLLCDRETHIATAFPIAYYDDINYSDELSKHHSLMVHSFPWLEYKPEELVTHDMPHKPNFAGKIKVGVVSSYFSSGTSIWGNFGETMRRLQSHPKLDVSFIYFPDKEQSITTKDKELSIHPNSNIYLSPSDQKPSQGSPSWISTNRKKIEEQKFDVILYLDMYMTLQMNMMATSKLAPVQICTHGHPVTSAMPKLIMDYYLSWDLAELSDKDKAQSFYTEELYRIDTGNKPWEYYEPRTSNEVSNISGLSFSHYTRENLDFIAEKRDRELLQNPTAKWYFCSQAPFKFSTEFDKILGNIQRKDPNAVILLVKMVNKQLEGMNSVIKKRLVSFGVDLSRVVFIPRMEHHSLMTVYKFSDVVLDSVYFGGDTTTRETFEVGTPIVTLPGKTIGQRWTQAYYRTMGMLDFIAKNADDYVKIAVDVANMDDASKEELRIRIKSLAHENLYRVDSHEKWAEAIIEMAEKPRYWHWKGTINGGIKEEL